MSSASGAKDKNVEESAPPAAAASAATNGGGSSATESAAPTATSGSASPPITTAAAESNPAAASSATGAADATPPPSENKSPAKAKLTPSGTPEQIKELDELTKKLAAYLKIMESGQGVRDTLNDDIASFLEKTFSQENLKKDRAILLELDNWLKHQAKILDHGSQDGDETLWSNQEPRIRMLMHKLCAFYGLDHNIMGPYQNSTIRIERQKEHFRNWNFSVSDLARYYELRDQLCGGSQNGGHSTTPGNSGAFGSNKEASPTVLNGEKKILRREGPPSTPKGGSPYGSGQQQATPPRTFEERRQEYDKRRKEIVGSGYNEQQQQQQQSKINSGYRRNDQSATSAASDEATVGVLGVSSSPSPQPQYAQVYLRDENTVYRLVPARVSELSRGDVVFIDQRGPLLTPDATGVYRYDPDQRYALAPAPVRGNPSAAAANVAVANHQQQQQMDLVQLANNYPASIPAQAATAGLYFAHPFAYHHPSAMAAANLPAVYPAGGAGGFFFPGSPPQLGQQPAATVAASQSAATAVYAAAAAAQHLTSPPPQQQQQQPSAGVYHQLQQQQQAAAMYSAYQAAAQFSGVPVSAAGYATAPQHYHQMAAAAAAAAAANRFVGPSLHLYSQPQSASVAQARQGGAGGIESQRS